MGPLVGALAPLPIQRTRSLAIRRGTKNGAWRAPPSSSRVPLACRASLRAIEVSRQLAANRATEGAAAEPLFVDPYAELLACGSGGASSDARAAAQDIIATKYIDERLSNAMAATNVNTINKGADYRQVVLLGDAMDTRPFRLMWPPGTLIFMVAPAEGHEQAEALLKSSSTPAHVMRGCLLRRVNMNWAAVARAPTRTNTSSSGSSSSSGVLTGALIDQALSAGEAPGSILMGELERAGFRGDRLSVWAVQGLKHQGLSFQQLQDLFVEVTNCAAFHSLLMGELPGPMSKQQADGLLAEMGLLGAVYPHGAVDEGGYGRWDSRAWGPVQADGEERHDSWLFTAQQLRLSLQQMGIYEEHVAEAEATDEDFLGNFS